MKLSFRRKSSGPLDFMKGWKTVGTNPPKPPIKKGGNLADFFIKYPFSKEGFTGICRHSYSFDKVAKEKQ